MRPTYKHKFKRLLKLAHANITRNAYISITTTVMMALILFVFNVAWSLNALTQKSLNELESKVDLIVYISDDTSLYDITDMQNAIEGLSEVLEVSYTSKEEALKTFLKLYPEKESLFTDYGLANPLPGNFRITANSAQDHEKILQYLKESPYAPYMLDVESMNENKTIMERLIKVKNISKTLIFGIMLAFTAGSVVIVVNAIHLSIFTRKKEIQIMQMVGAHPDMIRLPFLIEGAIYSLTSVLFSFILLYLFMLGTGLKDLLSFKNDLQIILLLSTQMGTGLLIGLGSSLVAINFYLKRNFDLEK